MSDDEQSFDQVHIEASEQEHPKVSMDKQEVERHNWWIGGWISPILAAAFTAFWGLMIYALIGERPTHWQYGVVPYVPAQSYLISKEPGAGRLPKQIQLPPRSTNGNNGQQSQP